MAKEKKLSPEQIWESIKLLTDKEKIALLSDLQQLADQEEAERKQLSDEYQKVNGNK